ncbi:MAG: YolD-like family protein [Candidatus Izimaplasma sp.]|nr:YolD-like family protein [Candidatus Izimaplasma bacterium]
MQNEYVYHDRKMMKWMPFNALLEHGEYLQDLLQKKHQQQKPVILEDHYQELNYKLEEAYLTQTPIKLTLFSDQQYQTVQGTISQIDVSNKLLFLNNQQVVAQQIVDIELL